MHYRAEQKHEKILKINIFDHCIDGYTSIQEDYCALTGTGTEGGRARCYDASMPSNTPPPPPPLSPFYPPGVAGRRGASRRRTQKHAVCQLLWMAFSTTRWRQGRPARLGQRGEAGAWRAGRREEGQVRRQYATPGGWRSAMKADALSAGRGCPAGF